ncbi:hypothetical protein [Azospirillum sp.]|uniref:hypothetical protein n=1 Tax=Azospirillum sp. TaxID=34012 RepID=UPI003D7665F1
MVDQEPARRRVDERPLNIRLASALRYLHAFPTAPKAHELAEQVLADARAAGLLEDGADG